MKRFIIKAMQAIVAVLIYAGILWYSINADADASGATDYGMIAVISLGIAYGVTVAVFRVSSEIGGSIMVIAAFLNRHLLEPQKQRLMAQGLEQGLEQGRHQGLEQGLEQGRHQGLEQGLEQGRHQGLEQGLEQGRHQGLEQGLEQGRHQGLEQGLEQGRKEERNNIREHLRQQGYDPDELLPPQEDDRK